VDGSFVPAVRALAMLYQRRHQWQEAVAAYSVLLDKLPELTRTGIPDVSSIELLSEAALARGMCYLSLSDPQMALLDFTALIALGEQHQKQQQQQQLQPELAALLKERHAVALHLRGRAYAMQEKWPQVLEDNSAALRLRPQLVDAYKDRAIAYEMLGRTEPAEQDKRLYQQFRAVRAMQMAEARAANRK